MNLGAIIALILIIIFIGNIFKKRRRSSKKRKPKLPVREADLDIAKLLHPNDKACIISSAQRMVDIINESLQIANNTKNIDTKISRVRLARHKFEELKIQCALYQFIKMERAQEIEQNIQYFEKEIAGLPEVRESQGEFKNEISKTKRAVTINFCDIVTKAAKGKNLVNGKHTWGWADIKKHDLEFMKKCCDAELSTGLVPAPYYFERVAILSSRLLKNHHN